MLRLSLKLLSLYLLFTAVFYVKVKLANFLFHLFSPCADTFVCFAIFVDFVKWKTYKLTVYDGNGGIEGIACSICCSTEFAVGIFQIFIENTYCVTECVAIRVRVAATEQGYRFVG